MAVIKNEGGVVAGLLSLSLSNNTSPVQIAIVAKQKIEPWIWMPAKFRRTSMQLPNQILRLPWTAPYDDKADINDEDDDGEEEEEEEEEGEQEHPSMLHRQEGDRVIARKDEFSTSDGVSLSSANSLSF